VPALIPLLPFAGSHLVWNGIVPDYSMAEARAIFQRHLRDRVLGEAPGALGGFKIDEVDGIDAWLWPDLAEFPSGHDGEQMRQTYGLFLQRLVLDDVAERHGGQRLDQEQGISSGRAHQLAAELDVRIGAHVVDQLVRFDFLERTECNDRRLTRDPRRDVLEPRRGRGHRVQTGARGTEDVASTAVIVIVR